MRLWYTTSKAAGVMTWVPPYVTVSPNNRYPAISLTAPLFVNTTAGMAFRGSIGMTTYLSTIGRYLRANFNVSGLQIFIVDSATEILIATNLPCKDSGQNVRTRIPFSLFTPSLPILPLFPALPYPYFHLICSPRHMHYSPFPCLPPALPSFLSLFLFPVPPSLIHPPSFLCF